jgi:talin
MSATKQGSKVSVACEKAIEDIDDAAMDLDAQLIIAQNNQLDPFDNTEKFINHQPALESLTSQVQSAVDQVNDALASASIEDMTRAVSSISEQMLLLRDIVKKAAAAITSADRQSQEKLLDLAKQLAEQLISFVRISNDAFGKGTSSTEVLNLNSQHRDVYEKLQSLQDVIKSVAEQKSRGARVLEIALEDIANGLAAMGDMSQRADGVATPEDFASVAKVLVTAAANLIASSSRVTSSSQHNQEEFIAAISATKKLVLDLMRVAKCCTEKAPEDSRIQIHQAARNVADSISSLLSMIHSSIERPNAEKKAEIQAAAKNIASAVNTAVEAAGEILPGGYVDPNDPSFVAERELLAAASSIEAAARKLATLKPPQEVKEADESLNFEEQIVEAAKAIAAATVALVKSATTAQREIANKRRSRAYTNDTPHYLDGAWSEGLVSGAKNVALATGDLCEAANGAVKGEVERTRVIAAARNVSASTQQLLTAAAVSADPYSQAQIRLRAAGKSVVQATENLVKAAEESMVFDETTQVTALMKNEKSNNLAMQRAQELDAQSKVLQMEKELEMARKRLAGLRKDKYAK